MGNCCSAEVDFDGEPNLFHFALLRAVGKGAFGKVRIIEHKVTKKKFALKYINKSQCIKQKAVQNIISERRMLEEIDHPYICNMRYAFQDDENCFFVLDLMLGGDLRFHLERQGPMPEKVVRLWTAELSSAVEYLHRQRIIHRDIKPDNILLDEAGHVHLTDFNVAIHYSARRLHTSVGGSLAYMAPEMLSKRASSSSASGSKPMGYTWCVDWWSLGITMFEVIYGRRPFDAKSAESMKKQIRHETIRYEGVPGAKIEVSAAALSLLRGFLEREPLKRLGCRAHGQGLADIHAHAWFEGLDWDAVEAKQVAPAYVPNQEASNFDVTHELDEFLMLEKPLAHKQRKEGVDIEKMSPEKRELETQFTVYDYSAMQRMSYFPADREDDARSMAPTDFQSRAASPATIAPRPSMHSVRDDRQPSPTGPEVVFTPDDSDSPVPGHSPPASIMPTATILENRSATATPLPQPVPANLQQSPPPLPTARRSSMKAASSRR